MTTTPTYHKIESVFKRDPDNHHKTFIMWEWSYPELDYLAPMPWVATEKVDGTNMRIHVGVDEAKIGGRTNNAQLHIDLLTKAQSIGEQAMELDINGLTLYGEGYGAGVQKGGDYRPDKGFVLFDVMVSETGVFLERENVEDIARQLDVPVVPIMWVGSLETAVEAFQFGGLIDLDSDMREGEVEGWVLRPETELRTRLGKRVITKIKVRDFPDRGKA